MKLLHSTTTMLNTKEFNKLSDNIIDKLYDINPDIKDLYDIHINFIDDSWQIDFLSLVKGIPALKAEGYTEYTNRNIEVLKVNPQSLTDLPNSLKLVDSDRSYDLCMNYVVVFEFILGLYDFEYAL